MSDIYLSITETPTVVTLTNPLISSNVAQSVTVTNVVSVNVVTMPAITVQAAAPSVTTVAGTVAVSNFPASSSVTIANFPSVTTVTGTVALDSVSLIALENVTVTVGSSVALAAGSAQIGSVTVANFPSTQTIAGTVTANIGSEYYSGPSGVTYSLSLQSFTDGGEIFPVGLDEPLPVKIISGSVTVGNSVTIGSLPAISGTVTARLQDASGNNLTSTSIGGVQRLNVSLASAATPGGTLPTFVNVYGGSDSGTVRAVAVDSSGRSVVTVSNFPATQDVSLASTTVTVSALPSGALTTRFGSVTTANTAQITSAVTNASRKYLLTQNISAGTVTIGIGFSPTTTQGIQLTAGGGLTFDAFCPTGAVYWLGAVTGAAFTILEG